MTDAHLSVAARPPDLIMAELWEIKRQLNQEAGFRLEELTRMAKEAADQIRNQWDQTHAVSKGGASQYPTQ